MTDEPKTKRIHITERAKEVLLIMADLVLVGIVVGVFGVGGERE